MTTVRFLMALQRFVGRRGLPHTIYTDNAQTFHATNRELAELWTHLTAVHTHQYLAHHGVSWKFIPPRAAWWGGWWESMVGTTKRCVRKVLGRPQTDEEGLNIILISIEAALNSRTLVQDGDKTISLSDRQQINNYSTWTRTRFEERLEQRISTETEYFGGL
jgi:hypothetical protein